MAKRKSKKRRVRRKARRSARMSRSKSRSKSRSRRRNPSRRRRNPGNFKKPTPTVAQAHLDAWAKQGVTKKDQIKVGMKAPYVGTLKTDADVTLAKIRFAEARQTANYYLDTVWKGGGPGYAETTSVHEAYKDALDEWKKAKKAGTVVPRPMAPSTSASATTGGNFRPVSKARAEAYLVSAFRWPKKSSSGTTGLQIDQMVTDDATKWARLVSTRTSKSGKAVHTHHGYLGARLAEAVAVVGAAKAAEIFRRQQANAVAYEKKQAEKKAKTDAANRKRWEKQLEKLQKQEQKIQEKLGAAKAEAVAARARRSRRRRSRRRNPVVRRAARRGRRRNPCGTKKGGRRRNCGTKQGGMRRRRKAKRVRKAKRRVRRAKKAKRSSRKAKRSRRRR